MNLFRSPHHGVLSRGVVMLTLVGALAVLSPPALGDSGGDAQALNGSIAYSRFRWRTAHVFLVHPDGTWSQLTSGDSWNQEPQISPDGTRVAYTSERAGLSDVYVVATDGTGEIRVTGDNAWETGVSWSPDGTRLAYVSRGNLWVARADGSGATQLTSAGTASAPEWSPNGSQIAFVVRAGYRSTEIAVISSTGSNYRLLTSDTYFDFHPTWSPDSTRVAFAHKENGRNYEIYVARADGAGLTRMTMSPSQDIAPEWSPTAESIAYRHYNGEAYDLRIVDVTTLAVRTLVAAAPGSGVNALNWSPDGAYLALTKFEGSAADLYTIGADGLGLARITTTTQHETMPDWGALPGT